MGSHLERYINEYRNAGYQGVIQVVQYKYKNHAAFLNAEKTIQENIDPEIINLNRPVTITHEFNQNQMLDITCLDFDSDCSDDPIKINYVPEEFRNSDNPYYKGVRKYIGNKELINSGINAIVENENGKIAIAKRADTGDWALPAGAKEIGVSIPDTVRTELNEELGIEVKDLKLIALMSGEKFNFTYPNGHKIRFIDFLYHAKHASGELRINDDENTEVAWVAPDELKNILLKRYYDQYLIFKNYQGDVILL
jgi:8-oxo-dGTP diphosphatase